MISCIVITTPPAHGAPNNPLAAEKADYKRPSQIESLAAMRKFTTTQVTISYSLRLWIQMGPLAGESIETGCDGTKRNDELST